MATLTRKPGANADRREAWMRTARVALLARSRLVGKVGMTFPDDGVKRESADGGRSARAELKRLEEGGDAIVQGWSVGIANDFSLYVLKHDGSLSQVDESSIRRRRP